MNIKRYNISKPEKYTQNNEEKTRWNTVGTITEFYKDDGSVGRLISIPAIGLECPIFEQTEVAQNKPLSAEKTKEIEYPEEYINVDDIPF